MNKVSRRDFLVRSGRAGLAASIGAPLVFGCWGEDVYDPAGVYDVLILGGGAAGAIWVDPTTLLLRGTANVAVVDASLHPDNIPGHPADTIMAVAERAGDMLAPWLR